MAKTKISEFSSTPANNTDIDSINIAEGCAPSGINDAIRELMAQLKDFQTGAQGDSFNGPIGTSTAAAGAFTTLSATGAITSTLATGTAPLVIASTTKVANLNVDLLDGADWASPAALGSTTPAAGSFTTLGASSTATLNTLVSSGATLTGGTINGMTIGATTASTGAFTTLAASSTVTLSGGTANGVAYLNGSKVLTTGSALAFDGSNVTANGSFTSGTTGVAGSFILARSSDGAGTTVLESLAATNNIGLRNTVGSIIFSANNSEGMRLTSTGLGIGTSSPAAKLHVKVGTNQNLHISTDGTTLGLFGVNDAVSAPVSMQIQGLDLRFNTGTGPASERMRLNSDGNLGLGVTPSAWTTGKAVEIGVAGNAVYSYGTQNLITTCNAYLQSGTWKYAGSYPATYVQQDAGVHKWFNAPSGTAGNAITFTQAMTLDASGNLGVGTTSPAGVGGALGLHVNGPSGASTSVRITNGDTGSTATDGTAIFVGNAAGAGATSLNIYNYESSPIALYTGGTERARIDSAGNLGLGVTPSAWGSGQKAIQIGSTGIMYTPSARYMSLGSNFYDDGTNGRYLTNGNATIYQQNRDSGVHAWYTAPSGTAGNAITFTQAMTLDASGRLGVGVTSPSAPIDVVADSGALGMKVRGRSSDNFSLIQFTANNGSTDYAYVGAPAANTLAFYTNGFTERARIDSSGNLLLGATSTVGSAKFYVLGGVANFVSRMRNSDANPSGVEVSYTTATINSTGNDFLYCADATALRAEIRSNGGLANYSANNVNLSDRREKTNFAPAGSYLEKICAIPVQTFNYVDQNLEEDDGLTLGVVAQDVQAVAPELVTEGNWGTKDEPKMRLSIYQTDLQYALMKALQELKAEFDAYKASHP